MLYRTLGKTGLKVAQLGFGAMRLPMSKTTPDKVDRDLATPLIHRAFEAGVNYIDTAVFYCNEDSQCAVGEALKGWRDRVTLSTKNHYYGDDEKAWWTNLENSLARLQVDTIDIYHHHGINWKQWTEVIEPRVSKWMIKAKDQGLVKHIAFSFHDNNEALMKLVDTGYAEVVTLQYNMLDQQLEEGVAHAHEAGMGVVVMGPVGGGRLGVASEAWKGVLDDVARIPELALRFVLSNPNVSLALSGMESIEHVQQNVRVCSSSAPLSDEEKAAIQAHLQKLQQMADLYCTGCQYCMPCEPAKVNIAEAFRLYNYGRVYGMWDWARRSYGWLSNPDNKNYNDASACTQCGACESKCPQNIPIREQLKEAHKNLAPSE